MVFYLFHPLLITLLVCLILMHFPDQLHTLVDTYFPLKDNKFLIIIYLKQIHSLQSLISYNNYLWDVV